MTTEKQKFINWLKKERNAMESPVLQTILRIPSCYRDNMGNTHIVGNVHVCMFSGVNTRKGDLGCVTFAYQSKTKAKRCRIVEDNSQLFKHVFIPKDADEAIATFEKWFKESYNTILTWKHII